MSSDDPPEGAQLDERYVPEWVEYGFSELISYLTKWANFDQWLAEHEEEYP